jgi:hypothetical protein
VRERQTGLPCAGMRTRHAWCAASAHASLWLAHLRCVHARLARSLPHCNGQAWQALLTWPVPLWMHCTETFFLCLWFVSTALRVFAVGNGRLRRRLRHGGTRKRLSNCTPHVELRNRWCGYYGFRCSFVYKHAAICTIVDRIKAPHVGRRAANCVNVMHVPAHDVHTLQLTIAVADSRNSAAVAGRGVCR